MKQHCRLMVIRATTFILHPSSFILLLTLFLTGCGNQAYQSQFIIRAPNGATMEYRVPANIEATDMAIEYDPASGRFIFKVAKFQRGVSKEALAFQLEHTKATLKLAEDSLGMLKAVAEAAK